MAIPTWYRTREVLASTWAIDDHGHDVMWLLRGAERALLVDTGFGVSDLAALATEIMGASLPLIVANTHGHHDHAGGNWQFPRVYIGAEDVAMVNQPMPEEARQAAMQRLLPSEDAAARELLAHGSFLEKWAATVPAEIVPIREGFVFDLGGRVLEVIAVPGHTPGSLCLLDRQARALFSGDDVHSGDIWMHLDHSTTLSEYLRSLRHLLSYQDAFDRLLWGHSMDPAPASLLPTLVAAVEGLIEGRLAGEPWQTFAGDGLRYDFCAGKLIYRADRLC